MNGLMPIGEFSDRSGLSQKRLRTYAADGLLVPAAVDSASGYRYYAPSQLRDARLIEMLRKASMPLSEIGALLRDPTPERLDAWGRRLDHDAAECRRALSEATQLLGSDGLAPAGGGSPARKEATMKLRSVSRSETGPVRNNNEDAVVGSDRLAAVADGMGGPPGGELASSIAVSVVRAAFTGSSLDELAAGVRAANWAIWARGSGSPELEGMGTTICAVGLLPGDGMAVVNVGDSRAYLVHNGSLNRMTEDHSVTAELVRRGELSEDEAHAHPHHGVLTRALGVSPDVVLDGAIRRAAEGDRLLVCSDGLVNEVSDHEIASLLRDEDLDGAADGLIELAMSRGGRDNVSVVIADVSS